MDPINPWLDPVEVRRLAERLLTPIATPRIAKPDAGFNEAFVGYATSSDSSPSSSPAPEPTTPPSPAPAPPVEPFQADPTPPPEAPSSPGSARGPFLDRIVRFRDWLGGRFSATGIFILDREGSVIFDESGHGKLHFLARSLALAARRPGDFPGNVHVKVGPGATLEVIPVETPYGRLVLGAVVATPLPPEHVQAVMEALSQVASPPPAS